MSGIDLRPITIYVAKQPGCAACKKAEPQIEKFKAANPMQLVVELDISRAEWMPGGVKIKATPTYIFLLGREPVMKHEGILTKENMEKVIKQIREEV